MENIAYVGLSQQLALQQQMEIAANNIANVSTPGYKSQKTLFIEHVTAADGGREMPARQSMNFNTYSDFSSGALMQTSNTFDIGLNGDGFFAVQTPQGIRYTRDGSFSLNTDRTVVNKSGYPLLNENNEEIRIPADVTRLTITPDGELTSETGTLGRIRLANFETPQLMKRAGENLWTADDLVEVAPRNTRLQQGSLEGSNVNPILEMSRMIELLRNFQSTQKMLQTDHDRIRGAIQKLTSV